MPRICEFYGIAIYMYFNDHRPPHFHAVYDGFEAEIEIASAAILGGHLPDRATRMVRDWTIVRRLDLMRNWDRARLGQPLQRIAPLE